MLPKYIFRVRALCFKTSEAQRYPIRLRCDREIFLTDRNQLTKTLQALESRYLDNDINRYCYRVEELPLNQLYTPSDRGSDEVFEGLTPNDLYRYFEHLPNRAEVSRICGWRFRQGDIVEVLWGNKLTLGIVMDTPPQAAASYYRAHQFHLSQARGEVQNEWPIYPSAYDNRYRVLLFKGANKLSVCEIPAQHLLQEFTLEATQQREILQQRITTTKNQAL